MTRRPGFLLLSAALLFFLFWVANRGAYKGFFQDDDLDNLGWTVLVDDSLYLKGVLSPRFERGNFRPVGHAYFHWVERYAGSRYGVWVGVLQLLHGITAILVFLLIRRCGVAVPAAFAAACFFLFHPSTFDAYWRPMYVFDVCCALFSMLSLLLWTRQKWVLSFIAYWLAFKAKELAVMLPLVILAWEWFFGERRWKPLLPFFAASASFGIQALLANRGTHDAYSLRITPATVASVVWFYLGSVISFGSIALTIIAFPVLKRDRRVWFGLAGFSLLLLPLLALPGRQFTVYLYVPLAFLVIAAGAALERLPLRVMAAIGVVWAGFTFMAMREYRREALAIADENRTYFRTLEAYLRKHPVTSAFIHDGRPQAMNIWGVPGAATYLRRKQSEFAPANSPEAAELLKRPDVAVLTWDYSTRRLHITGRDSATPDEPYISIGRDMPVWQFLDGWYGTENKLRWTAPFSRVRLACPPGASAFELVAKAGEQHVQRTGRVVLRVKMNGEPLFEHAFTNAEWQTIRVPLRARPGGSAVLEFLVEPAFEPDGGDPRRLGVAVTRLGFIS